MTISLDYALEKNALGPFHYMMLLLCGLSFMADALEVNLLSFLATCAGDQWNLSNTEQASITSVVFGGIIAGSMFWGSFADKYGRRTCFIAAASVITVGGFLTCVAPSLPYLLLFRGIVGFGIGGANVPFDLLAEFLPSDTRGSFLILIEFFWTFGSMFVAGTAWLFLGEYGWRTLAGITAVPIAIASLWSIFYLPESPRWLLSQGRGDEAVEVVRQSYARNGLDMDAILGRNVKFHAEDSDAPREENKSLLPTATTTVSSPLFSTHDNDSDTSEASTSMNTTLPPAPANNISYLDLFFKPKLRSVTLPLWGVWAMFGFTYYGLILFVTRVYSTSDDDGNDDDKKCSFDYASIFYNSLAELAGTTVAVFLVERIGRVNLQIVFYAFAGIFVGLVGAPVTSGGVLALSFLGRLSIMVSTNATWVLTPELYSTEYRTFAHATCVTLSKIGAFISPYIVVSSFSVPAVAVILGCANILAAVAASRLPDSTGMSLGHGRENSIAILTNLASDQSRSRSFGGSFDVSASAGADSAARLHAGLLADDHLSRPTNTSNSLL